MSCGKVAFLHFPGSEFILIVIAAAWQHPMPRKLTHKPRVAKKAKIISHPTPRQGITAYAKSSYKWAESYTSLLLGVVVIIVAVLFVVSLIRATHHVQDTSSTAIGPSPTNAPTPTPISTHHHMYIVQAGENLWSIAEKVYGSGYNWVDIAKANNLTDPSVIFSGDQLTMPSVITPEPSTVTPTPSPLGQINQKQVPMKYTVESGDNLWDIAVKVYNSGYRWVDIAKVNNLTDPNMIFSGNVLTLPR